MPKTTAECLFYLFESNLSSTRFIHNNDHSLNRLADEFGIISLIKNAVENQQKSKISAYIDGEKYFDELKIKNILTSWTNGPVHNLNDLSSLPVSVKLANLQLCTPELWQLCKNVSSMFKWQYYLTLNMYITPSHEANCFTLHSDPNDTIIHQRFGSKNWHLINNPIEFSYDLTVSGPQTSSPSLEKINLHSDEFLYFPKGMIHQASLSSNVPSVHLTYSLNTEKTYIGMKRYLKKYGFKFNYNPKLHFKTISDLDIRELLLLQPELTNILDLEKIKSEIALENIVQFRNGKTPYYSSEEIK